jgi:histone H3/H4
MSELTPGVFRADVLRLAMEPFEHSRLRLSESALGALGEAVDDGVAVFERERLFGNNEQVEIARRHIGELATHAVGHARARGRQLVTEEDIAAARESCQFWPFC